MKVLVNAISAKKGGILTYTRNLVDGFARRGIQATFAVPRDFPAVEGAHLLRQNASEFRAGSRLLWEQTVWRKMVADIKPDVLFSSANFGLLSSPVPQMLLLREGGLFDSFYLANFAPSQGVRLSILRRWRRALMIWSARRADMVITPTEAMREFVLQWVPQVAPHCFAAPYGTLEAAFQPVEGPRPWRSSGGLKLLYVSVYYAHKNPGVMVQAVEQMRAGGDCVSARITMTVDEVASTPGGGVDAIRLAQGQQDGCVALGRHPYEELPELYRSHDVFVFPSVSETFGHPMAEALSSGMPVVAADHPVNREICGDAALYFSPFSASDLVAQLRKLDENPGLREDMGRRGRERVLALYTWDAHVDRLVGLLEQVAQGKGG